MSDDDVPLFRADDLERWKRGELPTDWMRTQMAVLKRRAERFCDEFGEQIEPREGDDPASLDG